MNKILALLATIPLDKCLHFIVSVPIFALVNGHYGPVRGLECAIGAHVLKKTYDVVFTGRRDWAHTFFDIFAGTLGAVSAYACTLTF